MRYPSSYDPKFHVVAAAVRVLAAIEFRGPVVNVPNVEEPPSDTVEDVWLSTTAQTSMPACAAPMLKMRRNAANTANLFEYMLIPPTAKWTK